MFRGTDSTIIGWKEDFNMGFADNVPAQQDAAEYVKNASEQMEEILIRLCGHSKGGNLAVYSAAFCTEAIQRRILEVRNFDGPGFNEKNIHLSLIHICAMESTESQIPPWRLQR